MSGIVFGEYVARVHLPDGRLWLYVSHPIFLRHVDVITELSDVARDGLLGAVRDIDARRVAIESERPDLAGWFDVPYALHFASDGRLLDAFSAVGRAWEDILEGLRG